MDIGLTSILFKAALSVSIQSLYLNGTFLLAKIFCQIPLPWFGGHHAISRVLWLQPLWARIKVCWVLTLSWPLLSCPTLTVSPHSNVNTFLFDTCLCHFEHVIWRKMIPACHCQNYTVLGFFHQCLHMLPCIGHCQQIRNFHLLFTYNWRELWNPFALKSHKPYNFPIASLQKSIAPL